MAWLALAVPALSSPWPGRPFIVLGGLQSRPAPGRFCCLPPGPEARPSAAPPCGKVQAARLHTRRRSGPSHLRAPRWLAGQCPGAPEPGPLLKLAIPTAPDFAPCIARAAPAGCLALSSYSNG